MRQESIELEINLIDSEHIYIVKIILYIKLHNLRHVLRKSQLQTLKLNLHTSNLIDFLE